MGSEWKGNSHPPLDLYVIPEKYHILPDLDHAADSTHPDTQTNVVNQVQIYRFNQGSAVPLLFLPVA
jgi:hypothetical protein